MKTKFLVYGRVNNTIIRLHVGDKQEIEPVAGITYLRNINSNGRDSKTHFLS